MEPGFWDFHERDNPVCPACIVPPVRCGCRRGRVHIQLNESLDATEAKCDRCSRVDVPELVAVE